MLQRRGSGILLPLFSLPSAYGMGDLGEGARTFLDFLAETRQSVWQILPVTPTDGACGHSPYSSSSAFAGNPLLVDVEDLVQEGFLEKKEIPSLAPSLSGNRVCYEEVLSVKGEVFEKAYGRFRQFKKSRILFDYEEWVGEHSYWLEDFSLFQSLKRSFQGQPWRTWPTEIRDRRPEALKSWKDELAVAVEKEKFLQYLFYRQWRALKRYAQGRFIQIMGDVPLYVQEDSADVWAHPELFKLDEEKRPVGVAGVPPDYFSRTGQRWGNPVYHWEVLKKTGYVWWIQRLRHSFSLFDWVRLDHFRGLVAYWEIPAGEETAIKGRWVDAPAHDFFTTLFRSFPSLPVIAEDLGVITADVREVIDSFHFPTMKVLQFAFGDDFPQSSYLPHQYEKNCVVYTGTHDNTPTRSWFEKEATGEEKERLCAYLGREVSAQNVSWELMRLAMSSVARLAIFPLQDVLGLGEEARMNRPASREGNWRWRLSGAWKTPQEVEGFRTLTERYDRA